MLARHNVAAVCAHHHEYPMFADVTADFVYARLQCGTDDMPTCYSPEQIAVWANRFKHYAQGGVPADLPMIAPSRAIEKKPRDVFAFFITGGKVNAPTGAQKLQLSVSA